MTENAISMESRKNLVRSFMATMPVLTEATQDDLSQIDNSFSARSRRLMDASYGNQNPYEIEKARQAETESRQRTTIQEHAARTFQILNWERQMTAFGGIQMTNAEKLALVEEMAENAEEIVDEAIELGEVQEGRRHSVREDLRERRKLERKAMELGGHENLSSEDRVRLEQLNQRLERIDQRAAERREYRNLQNAIRERGGIDQLSQQERERLQVLEQKKQERDARRAERREHNNDERRNPQETGRDGAERRNHARSTENDLTGGSSWSRGRERMGLIGERKIETQHDLCNSFTCAAAPNSGDALGVESDITGIEAENKPHPLPGTVAPTASFG